MNDANAHLLFLIFQKGGGGVAQSVERTTPGDEFFRCGRSLTTVWVGISM